MDSKEEEFNQSELENKNHVSNKEDNKLKVYLEPAKLTSNNKLKSIINYFLSFSKSKMIYARNIDGSRRPPINENHEWIVPIVFVTMRHGTKEVFLKAPLDSRAGASIV